MSLLEVNNLCVEFRTRDGIFRAVDNVSFNLEAGEILGIVGESGSGKSVTCYTLLKLIAIPPGHIVSGQAKFDGIDLLQANEKILRNVRSKRIGIIFQDPMTSLNPYLRIGYQLLEPLLLHDKNTVKVNKKDAYKKAIALLDEVGIKDSEQCMHQYPHELSGGMRQRVMIAMALITEPEILIADEPTTALDVTTQAQILDMLVTLQKSRNVAVIFISHDLQVVNYLCDNVLVMKDGKVVESGLCEQVFTSPRHDYTQQLIQAIPDTAKPAAHRYIQYTKNNDTEKDILKLSNITIQYASKPEPTVAVDNVSMNIANGEVLGLVGESGCGKSTLSYSLVRLVDIHSGSIQFHDEQISTLNNKDFHVLRKNIQIIFQDPYSSLNPRMTVFNALAEPITLHDKYISKEALQEQVFALMSEVGLDKHSANKYPHEFSGGQRQRIAIARALAIEPELIIADEPVSALDVTIQAQILDLLLNICQRRQMTMLFISHDLAVIRYISDRVAVMQAGKIVEEGNTETVFHHPVHSYTKKLLASRIY